MPRMRDPGERFDSHVDILGGIPDGMTSHCWVWTGASSGNGYAQFHFGGRKNAQSALVHRWNYERLVAPIPNGYQVDHLCKVTLCVNPQHLEAVPGYVNNARSDSPTAINARMVMCGRGTHLLAGDNLHPTYLRYGQRRCRTCVADRQREYRARLRVTTEGVAA